MPAANELVRYRRDGGGGGRSDNIVTDSSSNSNNGCEDWITRKRVETKTTRNVEKRVQRQLVLEDGRIIEQDDPEVTVDVVEDAQSHSDDGNEDRRVVGGGWDAKALQRSSEAVSAWSPGGGRTLGEKQQKNVYTTDVTQRSRSTTSAQNVGDISSKDVAKVIREGRSSKTFIRPYDDKVKIAPRLTHASSSQNRVVDTEDVQEVQREQDGKVKTDRYVTRECVEDFNEETPSDGESGSEPELRDGDQDSFSQRKEDKFVDYYSVPRGKTVREGKFLRHGIHMTSHDKNNKNGFEQTRRAIPYRDEHSDSAGELWSSKKKPPIFSGNKRRDDRVSSSERERESTKSPGGGDFHVRYSKISPKFHTIERSGRTSSGGNARSGIVPDRRRRSDLRSDHSDSSFPRSGSASRRTTQLPAPPLKGNLKRSSEIGHHRSVGNLRKDWEGERSSGRLKRTKSFTSHHDVGGEGKSLFGSFKSLYASLTKSSKKAKENKVSAANRAWFDSGDGRQPKPPPRKARSRTQSTAGGSSFDVRESSGNNRRWEMYSSSANLAARQPNRPRSPYNPQTRSPQPRTAVSHRTVSESAASLARRSRVELGNASGSSVNLAPGQPNRPRSPYNPPPRTAVSPQTVSESAASSARWRRSRVELGHASGSSVNLHSIDRREPKRFEEERQQRGQVKSRFFGQQDDSDTEDGGKRHERPPPDMRRLLLNNVNLTRSKSMNKDPEQTPSLIRSM